LELITLYKEYKYSSFLFEIDYYARYVYTSDPVIGTTYYSLESFTNEFIKINEVTDEEIIKSRLNYREYIKVPINYSGYQYYKKGTNLKYIFKTNIEKSNIKNENLFIKYFLELNKDADVIQQNGEYILNQNK
jgi:hypothetical protein